MPYCVNCGVELNEDAKACPLCQTPVIRVNPAPPLEEHEPFFPEKRAQIEPVSKRELAILLTIMLASVAICCTLLNLFIGVGHFWALYIVGAAIMLWIWFVLPLLLPKMPTWIALPLDVLVVGLYAFLVSVDLDGGVWFRGLILPIILSGGAIVLVLSFLLRDKRHHLLTTAVLCLSAIALGALAVELWCDLYLHNIWQPTWSLIVLTVCAALAIPLIIVRRVPTLREEARRRFHI